MIKVSFSLGDCRNINSNNSASLHPPDETRNTLTLPGNQCFSTHSLLTQTPGPHLAAALTGRESPGVNSAE